MLRAELIRVDQRKRERPQFANELDEIADDLRRYFKMDMPQPRLGDQAAPGYDAILSQFHNPLEIGKLFTAAGLREVGRYFYHFHAVPPLYEERYPRLFRELSLALELEPTDWRGHFMASAFVVEAVRDSSE